MATKSPPLVPLTGGWTRKVLIAWLKAEVRRRYKGTPQRIEVGDTLRGEERDTCRNTVSKLRHVRDEWGGGFTSWENALNRAMPGDSIEVYLYDWTDAAAARPRPERDVDDDVELQDTLTIAIPATKPA